MLKITGTLSRRSCLQAGSPGIGGADIEELRGLWFDRAGLSAEPVAEKDHFFKITINSAVGGMADGNGQDLFRFSATAGQRIVIDCQSGVLDSNMDATMSLSAAGKLLASSGDYNGRDPFIDFLVPRDGEYEVLVHDLSYRGGLPYR